MALKMTIFDANDIKKRVASRYKVNLHIHDTCGGFFMELDEPNDEVAQYVDSVLTQRGVDYKMSDDGCIFIIGD
ncbi:MAG: hypothetical protein PUB39_01845 [Eubacteriales bacterium]|nr:hypothetical protein [Eubacteriales bacterium]